MAEDHGKGDSGKVNQDATTRETAKRIHLKSALVGDVWRDNVIVGISSDGWITTIEAAIDTDEVDESYNNFVALPGMPNVHSHAFQRAFAGLSEYRTAEHDSFWTWRKLMYNFLLKLNPEDVYVIARQLYLEMLLAGYTWVGEFQYIHNDINGSAYSNLSELSDAIVRAANDVGIGLCMLPVLYQRGGFDDSELSSGQNRFRLTNEQFIELNKKLSANPVPNRTTGIALHSLRAVSVKSASEILAEVSVECPVHIHVAEQVSEVEDCLKHHSQRPVEFLYENFCVDKNWCLIHATHLNDTEIQAIADSNAVVGLCPTTEANLGDGIFASRQFLDAGGRISIGSDSHCSVDLRDELRTLEYGQRLSKRSRVVLGEANISVGRNLYQQTAKSGGRAIGVSTGAIEVGRRADFTLVDPDHPAIAGATGDALIDRLIFCNADDPIVGTIAGGIERSMDCSETQELLFESQRAFVDLNRRLVLDD